ncbi:MAG: hypothetical protein GY899_08980 [Verrucomicrobiaceae bacterium]|nr:hypothetical protein [Verrucomicrobiaceae bacterium]
MKREYDQGLVGVWQDPKSKEEYLGTLEHQSYEEVCDDLDIWSAPKGALYLPYLQVMYCEARRQGLRHNSLGELSDDTRCMVWHREPQTVGDCVSHWCRAASDLTRASDINIHRDFERWITTTATETIYGHRNHAGHGASCYRLMKWITEDGGMMLRQNYPALNLDLSKYDAQIGTRWGRSGVPAKIVEVAKQHQILKALPVNTREGMRQAYRNGLAVGGCSYISYSRTRDEFGVSNVTNQGWAHAMQGIGYDDRESTIKVYGQPLVLEVNSWGRWNSGGRKIRGTELSIPHGSCWIRESDYVSRKVERGECFAFSGAAGWRAIPIDNFGFRGLG